MIILIMVTDTSPPIVVAAPGPHTATVIWLHGLGADGHDFEPLVPELRLPARHGIKFVFPHAPHRPVTINGGFVMRAWYDIRSAHINKIEDTTGILESFQLVNDLLDTEIQNGIVPERLALAGFSQGGALALYCGVRYPVALGAIVALSTYLPLLASTAAEHSVSTTVTPILMCHGVSDPIVPLTIGRQSADYLASLDYKVDWREYLMGHTLCDEEIEVISTWIKRFLI